MTSTPCKVLFLNHVAALGGAEKGLLDLATTLDRNRFLPQVVLPGPGDLEEQLAIKNIPVAYMPLRRFKRTLNPFRLAGYLLNMGHVQRQLVRFIRIQRIGILHANSNQAQLYAGPAARTAGIPVVWHSRDLVELGKLGPWMCARADRIIAISDHVSRNLARYDRENRRVTIHNGINVDEFRPSDKKKRKTGSSAEPPVFAMCGQLVPWKNHLLFLEVAAQIARALPAARFLMIGGDLFHEHEDYRQRLERRIRELGLEQSCRFTGYRPDIRAVLEEVDILIHPAEREPFGRAVAEAMALEIPAIAINAGGPSEIIRNGIDGFLTAPNAPAEMAQAALRLAGDPALALRIGATARKRILESFNLRDCTRKIEDLYEQLTKAHENRD